MMSIRRLYAVAFAVVAFLLAVSLYLQYAKNVIPCPLCMLQRCTFVLFGIVCLAGLAAPAKRWLYYVISGFASLTSFLGLLLAGRQIWVQHFPNNGGSECGASLQYMLEVFPIHEVLQKVLAGSAECSQQAWVFLSFDMAEWAFCWFAAFLLFSIYALIRAVRFR